MDDDSLRLQLPRSRRNRLVGKLVLVLALGTATGLVVAHYDQVALQHAKTITPEEYNKGFEAYKASLSENRWGVLPNVALFVATLFLFFGVYELLGALLGAVFTKLTPNVEPPESQTSPPRGLTSA